MAITIGDNFSYKGRKPLDDRLVTQSLATLISIPDSIIYTGVHVYVVSEKAFYVYDYNNTSDPKTDKWRLVSDDSKIPAIIKYGKVFTESVGDTQVLDYTDVSSLVDIKDVKENQLVNDIAGIIAKVDSIDIDNNQITVTVISKDTIIKQDIVEYQDDLDSEISKPQVIEYSKLTTTETIDNFSMNNLVYSQNGVLAKVLAKDETSTPNTITVVPITLSMTLKDYAIYLSNVALTDTINSQNLINYADLNTSTLITSIDKNQLVYDLNGTVAKIDAVDLDENTIVTTTITTATDQSVNVYKYLGKQLNATPDINSALEYAELDTTKLLNDISVGELVYDSNGTLAKITQIDIPSAQIVTKTLTYSGMPLAPVMKELVIKEAGKGYQANDILVSTNTSGVYFQVDAVDSNGSILAVTLLEGTQTISTSGTDAIVDYDTVIYGAFGNNWSPLSNTSSTTAQIVEEAFVYETGYEYKITNPGTNYKLNDIVSVSGMMVEVTKVTNGQVEEVRYSREVTPSTLGSGLTFDYTASDDVFIIPTSIWSNAKRNIFDLTNNDGASVTFSRLDSITEKCSAGDGSIYKFTFDSTNGVIYQEKTEIQSDGSGIGKYVPYKNYKIDDVVIEDNLLYICNTDHTGKDTLGADIANWDLITKFHSSGQRYVQFEMPTQTHAANAWFNVSNMKPICGDESLMSSSELIAPVSGLYYFNINPFGSLISSGAKCSIIRILKTDTNNNSTYIASNQSSGNWQVQSSITSICHLEAGDKCAIQIYYNVVPKEEGFVSEFGLISEDQSDNLVVEANIVNPSTISSTETGIKVTNISNPAVLSETGVITLPEDGVYVISSDLVNSKSGGVSGVSNIYLRDKNSNMLSNFRNDAATNIQIPNLLAFVSGHKGDTYSLTYSKSTSQGTLTYVNNDSRFVRVFKVKSVNQTISTKDFYADYVEEHKNDAYVMTYDEWVVSGFQRGSGRVKATLVNTDVIHTSQTTFKNLTYADGDPSMLVDGYKFTAPVSGLYSFHSNMVLKGANDYPGIVYKTILCKNCDYEVNNIVACYSDTYPTKATYRGGVDTTIWLDKGEYLTLSALASTTLSGVQSTSNDIEFSLIQACAPNSYSVSYPNQWPENQEVYLGNDLYGYRARTTDGINITNSSTTTRTDTELYTFESEIFLVDHGGYVTFGESDRLDKYQFPIDTSVVPVYSSGAQPSTWTTCLWINKTGTNPKGGRLTLTTCFPRSSVKSKYDIWITYTKAGN